MGVVLTFGAQMPYYIKGGQMAGQFAKPRYDPFETKDRVKLPSYQGDNIISAAFDEKSHRPDPQRLLTAYAQSASTLNLIRAFGIGGYATIQRVTKWNLDFVENNEVDEALGFMEEAGFTMDHPIMTTTEFYMFHECIHLPYEQALTREDSTRDGGLFYDCFDH
ncbi:hypothetical protein MKW98_021587, partial [Papaver atlanticum]